MIYELDLTRENQLKYEVIFKDERPHEYSQTRAVLKTEMMTVMYR